MSKEFASVRTSRHFSTWFFIIAGGTALVVALVAILLRSHKTMDVAIHTVAVLPFENLSNETGNEHFCFGLVDEITTELAKNEQLRVIARTSASQFSRNDDVQAIGKRLNANSIVEGSVSRTGNTFRVNVQLIDVSNAVHLWAQSYERQSGDTHTQRRGSVSKPRRP